MMIHHLKLRQSLFVMGTFTLCTIYSASANRPTNVYQADKKLPTHIRRVVVLPLAVDKHDPITRRVRDTLEPILFLELKKLNAFDLVFLSSSELQAWTDKPQWLASEKLPPRLFDHLHELTDCDAVLFCRLTQFALSGTITVGWDFRLVDVTESKIWWAAEEVFDTGNPSITKTAYNYYRKHQQSHYLLNNKRCILQSPRRFGQFSARSLLATLPKR